MTYNINRAAKARKSSSRAGGALVGVGCLYLVLWLAFWITVIVVAGHFIAKFW